MKFYGTTLRQAGLTDAIRALGSMATNICVIILTWQQLGSIPCCITSGVV